WLAIEEPDRCARNAGSEGDSIAIVIKRTVAFDSRRILMGGSPTVKGESQIEREMARSDYRRYFIKCPEGCGHWHFLEWDNIIYDKDVGRNDETYGDGLPDTARFRCPRCTKEYSNNKKNNALLSGEWRPTQEGEYRGHHMPQFISPFKFASAEQAVADFLKARQFQKRGDESLMITWKNTTCGETWSRPSEKLDYAFLLERGESYSEQLAEEAEVITMGVDVQGNRLEAETVAWDKTLQSWSLSYDTLMGNPDEPEVWESLLELMRTTYQHPNGHRVGVSVTAIDSGGHHTQQVYKFCKLYEAMRAIAVMGRGGPGLPIKVKMSRTKHVGNWLMTVGVDDLKSRVYRMLQVEDPGPGYCHFPNWYPEAYYEGLTGEERIPVYVKGQQYESWENPPGVRNEPLDNRNYNMAGLYLIKPMWFRVSNSDPASPRKRPQQPEEQSTMQEPEVRAPKKSTGTSVLQAHVARHRAGLRRGH
ncbi:MAG: terminase gpA endonuclease subunit, partial [Geminicoccaceae bacterium]